MNKPIYEVILDEVRSLRESSDAFQAEALQRITAIETKITPLFDNGQPGLLTKLGNRITRLEHWRAYLLGISAAVSTAVAYVVKVLGLG